ncbi:MAG: DinB family protein [Gemmatimonadaceae bacterium]
MNMTMAEKLVAEFDREMPPTRKVIERVPSDKGQWKPHEKSFALAHLAQLVSDMPGWLVRIAGGVDINLAGGPGYGFHPTEKLLENFDKNVREGREALAAFKDSDYSLPWSLKMGDKVLFTDERGMVIRQTINHLCHHRGQLTVYLRLLDIPVPSVYGPTADEKMF